MNRYWILDPGYWILELSDPRCWMLDKRQLLEKPGLFSFTIRCWTFDVRCSGCTIFWL